MLAAAGSRSTTFDHHVKFFETVRLGPNPVESAGQDQTLAGTESFAVTVAVCHFHRTGDDEADLFDGVVLDLHVASVTSPDPRIHLAACVCVVVVRFGCHPLVSGVSVGC